MQELDRNPRFTLRPARDLFAELCYPTAGGGTVTYVFRSTQELLILETIEEARETGHCSRFWSCGMPDRPHVPSHVFSDVENLLVAEGCHGCC